MNRLAACAVLAMGTSAFADRVDTAWFWPSLTVETGEELFWGSTHHSYPATYLFDENPATAWVFSGLSPAQKVSKNYIGKEEAKPTYWIRLRLSRPTVLDGFEIMNGYNKSAKTFRKNRRVTEVEVWDGTTWFESDHDRPLKSTRLSDRMGWHRVSLPKRKYENGLTLRFTGFRGDPSLDVALSGIRLLKNGRPLNVRALQVVGFTNGSDCG
ncbi:MAG TPA: hypothetical protein VGE01_02180 [Fimbriimonas sp.]